MRRIVFTVTNDLNYDQRMHRICTSLIQAGFSVLLIGRKRSSSLPLLPKPFSQKRLRCLFDRGPLFYVEYNLRLFLFLLFTKCDAICAIDLDTILPCWLASRLKGVRRIYDAHEYFTQMVEVRERPRIARLWKSIERFTIPRFQYGYTVSEGLAECFQKEYGRSYNVIRNMPVFKPTPSSLRREKVILYQGAVNEGRGFEYLIPAMRQIDYKLIVVGEGNFVEKLQHLIAANGVESKVELAGMILPEHLHQYNQQATLGIGLARPDGANQYLALPNKFFDYIHAGLPQLTMNFPEYQKVNEVFEVAVLTDDLSPQNLAALINRVMADDELLERLSKNCIKARQVLCWQREEVKLTEFYNQVFS